MRKSSPNFCWREGTNDVRRRIIYVTRSNQLSLLSGIIYKTWKKVICCFYTYILKIINHCSNVEKIKQKIKPNKHIEGKIITISLSPYLLYYWSSIDYSMAPQRCQVLISIVTVHRIEDISHFDWLHNDLKSYWLIILLINQCVERNGWLFAGEVKTSFYCAARAFWFQTTIIPLTLRGRTFQFLVLYSTN